LNDTTDKITEYQYRLAAIVESSDDAIISNSMDGIVQSWNSGSERLFGYTADEMIGRSITVLEPAHRKREMAMILQRLRAGERIHHFETERVAKDGHIVEISLTISPIRDSTGKVVAASKVARDIGAQKAAEIALRQSEMRLRALVETQAEMICRFRVDGTILFANEAYARSQGTTADELVGQSFWKFIPEEEHADIRKSLDAMSPASPYLRVENRIDTVDGERWTLWTNRGLEFDTNGCVVEAQAIGIDITERKLMEQQLIQSDKLKDQFLATLGHELRNPLAPLRNGIELLKLAADNARVEELTALLDRQVQHLQRLVDDLVDISRINHGHIELRFSEADLGEVVRAAVELSSPLLDERRHRLTTRLGTNPPRVNGDIDRLIQVVANLLTNAAKYTRPGGDISVELMASSDSVDILVQDDGLGFPPELAESLFDMYTRVPQHQKYSGGGGLGVGLPLARQLVALHGGRIEASSKGHGKGSVFRVTLPRMKSLKTAAEVASQGTAGQGTRAHADQSGRRVLVVDDNVDAAASISQLLTRYRHDVLTVHDGASAIKALQSFSPDVVLQDIGIPGMDGYETARQMRALPAGKELLIAALTGWGRSNDKKRAAKAGFDQHLTKPADIEELLRFIGTGTPGDGTARTDKQGS
jgi:two-component system CheB/CheR fusion protein